MSGYLFFNVGNHFSQGFGIVPNLDFFGLVFKGISDLLIVPLKFFKAIIVFSRVVVMVRSCPPQLINIIIYSSQLAFNLPFLFYAVEVRLDGIELSYKF